MLYSRILLYIVIIQNQFNFCMVAYAYLVYTLYIVCLFTGQPLIKSKITFLSVIFYLKKKKRHRNHDEIIY